MKKRRTEEITRQLELTRDVRLYHLVYVVTYSQRLEEPLVLSRLVTALQNGFNAFLGGLPV